MFPGRYSEIFGLGERLGCILNLGQGQHAAVTDVHRRDLKVLNHQHWKPASSDAR